MVKKRKKESKKKDTTKEEEEPDFLTEENLEALGYPSSVFQDEEDEQDG